MKADHALKAKWVYLLSVILFRLTKLSRHFDLLILQQSSARLVKHFTEVDVSNGFPRCRTSNHSNGPYNWRANDGNTFADTSKVSIATIYTHR